MKRTKRYSKVSCTGDTIYLYPHNDGGDIRTIADMEGFGSFSIEIGHEKVDRYPDNSKYTHMHIKVVIDGKVVINDMLENELPQVLSTNGQNTYRIDNLHFTESFKVYAWYDNLKIKDNYRSAGIRSLCANIFEWDYIRVYIHEFEEIKLNPDSGYNWRFFPISEIQRNSKLGIRGSSEKLY